MAHALLEARVMRSGFVIAAVGAALAVAQPARADDAPVVHVRFPAGTFLPYVDRQTEGGWELACRAPCDRPLAAGSTYRIRGRAGNPSEPFVLPRTYGTRVDVDAIVGSPVAAVAGPILAVRGGVILVGSAALAVWPDDRATDHDRGGRVVVGIGGMIIGAIVAGAGVLLWHFGGSHASVAPSTLSPPLQAKSSASGVQWTGTGIIF